MNEDFGTDVWWSLSFFSSFFWKLQQQKTNKQQQTYDKRKETSQTKQQSHNSIKQIHFTVVLTIFFCHCIIFSIVRQDDISLNHWPILGLFMLFQHFDSSAVLVRCFIYLFEFFFMQIAFGQMICWLHCGNSHFLSSAVLKLLFTCKSSNHMLFSWKIKTPKTKTMLQLCGGTFISALRCLLVLIINSF